MEIIMRMINGLVATTATLRLKCRMKKVEIYREREC